MINAMRTLALDFIFERIGDNNSPQSLDDWYYNIREKEREKLFPFLVESVENIEKIYILQPTKKLDTVILSVEDMTLEKAHRLPFKQFRARAIGPVIKKTGESPNLTYQKATMKYFEKVAQGNSPCSGYFKEIFNLLNRSKLKLLDNSIIEVGENKKWANVFYAAMSAIPENKKTVIITMADDKKRLPGDRTEYRNYLMSELPQIKYCSTKISFTKNGTCYLCGRKNIDIFPNGLKGAGINLTNFDRIGVFHNIDESEAWKKYGLCEACADLLYIYKFHVLKKDSNKRNPFITNIAGDSAIVIPYTTIHHKVHQKIWRNIFDFIDTISSDTEEAEITILDKLKEEKGILNLTLLWASTRQEIKDVSGMITNVPPTRLRELSSINYESRLWTHPLFPKTFLRIKKNNFSPDLSLRALNSLFHRPGGKKAKDINESMKLKQLKKSIAAAVYHKTEIPAVRFREEIMITARWYFLDGIEKGNVYDLIYEGEKKTGEHYLTFAGWIRHLCWWIYYFKKLEVMRMETNLYEPQIEKLKPYFGSESGIDSLEKAYAFLLGVLYGKVLQVQGARGINVGANALTWLKRLTLKGQDIPKLYIKIREKLLAYETESNKDVRELVAEIGNIGYKLGDNIDLDETATNYYLLLGQSLTTTILPKKEDANIQTGGVSDE